MYIFKNAFTSIKRNKGRNILIALIIIVISAACAVTLAIRESANKIVASYEEQNKIEPTGNLDRDTENDILDILINLAHKENKCVIIVTHSNNVCDRVDTVYELKKG